MGSERADVGGVNATETTLDIIERIHQHGSGRVTVLARELGLAKARYTITFRRFVGAGT